MSQSLYDVLLTIHSAGRWVVLLLLLLAIFNHMAAGNRPYGTGDRKLSLFLMIAADLMLLVGIIQWFTSSNWGYSQIKAAGMQGVMQNSVTRFFTIEHMVGMILAIALIHIGKAQGKKNMADRAKHRRTMIFYFLALLIMVASIPWPFREVGANRGWI
jgi:hypothetical protein